MSGWHIVTIVGRDRPGLTSAVTNALFQGGCNLGEAVMARLGSNFTVMLMVHHWDGADGLRGMLDPTAQEMELQVHVEPVEDPLSPRPIPDVAVTVFGADRAGIVAKVTQALTDAGLNIVDLRSDVVGPPGGEIYVMKMEGRAIQGISRLREALDHINLAGVEVTIEPLDDAQS